MKLLDIKLSATIGLLCFVAGVGHSPAVNAQASTGGIDIAQQPLFTTSGQPPLNMLVMGKDHKIYYEAYNDASDLDGDGALDIGYKPATIDYYGYFNSSVCYAWDTDKFVPVSAATNKQCSGRWSGDFLNYLTTSRMDALRRVLYGGWRQVDSTTETVLQGAFFPQDGHSWGKEYQSVTRDGYDISNYAPLTAPDAGRYHLFAVTTVTGNANAYPNYQAPLFRVLKNTDKRVWNWLSIEGPVAGNRCFTATNTRVDCVTAATTAAHPGHPANRAAFTTMENTYAIPSLLFGTGTISTIDCNSNNCNPHNAQQDNYLSIITGRLRTTTATRYQFRVDGDDAIDFELLNATGGSLATAGCYGARGFGVCAGAERSAIVSLASNTNYSFKFRHEEGNGGDGYRLQWRTCTGTQETSCGTFAVVPSSTTHGIQQVSISTYNLSPTTPAVTRDDYLVRVRSCPAGDANAAVREASCKAYPNDQFKPTGILHDYGESTRMYFGLITGSQFNNLEGGVLRRNMSNFAEEINANTGQFRTNVDGIANTISRLRMIGGNYAGTTTNNLNSDTNWNWANGTGDCPSVGNRAINNGECRMWGNPLAEMLFESMRYFAGAGAPVPRFESATTNGNGEETTMGLTQATWQDPYGPADTGGGGFLSCAKPYQTIISDINPSYDGDLPGSAFAGALTSQGVTPASLAGFSASGQGQLIWNAEFGGSRRVFIGDVDGVTDGAPTAKTATSFGNIRGLSPEEPTKGGTYYSASVARYARFTDLHPAPGAQNLSTYAIALASPLPRIDFPWGGGNVSLLPFAKTVSGTFGDGTRKPTNTIVDFYVERIVNLPGQPFDATVNGGRPYAVFQINYEDVEQGNDHDMDAIVRYVITANADGTVTVTLNSEYAAGSANQNMGYVLAGTTRDGVYLDVRDTDSPTFPYQDIAGNHPTYVPATAYRMGYRPYDLNTPPGMNPGDCVGVTSAACGLLPTTSTRVFTPSAGGDAGGAIFLNDPLWYAAKYGAPVPTANDVDGDGVPDNYFLVTNPATLREQLDRAFTDIIATSAPSASVATSTPRFVPGVTLAYEASFTSVDWAGDLRAFSIRSDATYSDTLPVWSASQRMPAAAARRIFTAQPSGTNFAGAEFTTTGMSTATLDIVQGTLNPAVYANDSLIAYLRGDQSRERGATGCSLIDPTDCPFRRRGTRIGDILNSTPAVIGVTSFGYGSILSEVDPGAAASYPAYVESKRTIFGATSQNPILFFGANDGMLHAIDGREGTGGGTELFAYVPNAVLPNLHLLAQPGYVHRFFVDGSPTVTDAHLGTWRTVLLASTGAGGRSVFALDVTNPRAFTAANVLWEFNNSIDIDMGQFVGRPYAGITEDGTWVAAFGNGYNSASQRAILFIRDLATGAEVAKLDTGWGCSLIEADCGTGDGPRQGPNGLAGSLLVDNDGNGAGDTIYAGDFLGNLWRFELVSGSWQIGNNGEPLFTARDPDGKRQSITSAVYTVANPLGGTNVIFGTGRYLNDHDADEAMVGNGTRAANDTIYGIWDSRAFDPETGNWVEGWAIGGRGEEPGGLERQEITSYTPMVADIGGYRTATRNPVDYMESASASWGKMGWYLDLSFEANSVDLLAGERVTATPQGILSDVVFNTFRPEGNSCEPGSQNATLVLNSLSGAASYRPVAPIGGWPAGQEPPDVPGIIGTDTRRGPPPGEPPILIVRPPGSGIPCLPGSEGCEPEEECDPADPACEVIDECKWVSPNSGRTTGKPIPCGRISWKQLR